MDAWAEKTDRASECLAQIGRGAYHPNYMEWHETLSHAHFAQTMQAATIVIAHAGMGSVITAMRHATPIVMMPRRFEAGEHTTDHQMATARWLENKPGVFIAWDESTLADAIAEAEDWSGDGAALSPTAPAGFTDRLNAQFDKWISK